VYKPLGNFHSTPIHNLCINRNSWRSAIHHYFQKGIRGFDNLLTVMAVLVFQDPTVTYFCVNIYCNDRRTESVLLPISQVNGVLVPIFPKRVAPFYW